MKLPDHWFYGSATADDTRFAFSPEETIHATKVLRLREGDVLRWLDGAGGRFEGVITSLKRSGMLTQTRAVIRELPEPVVRLSVGILHDSARLEWLIEKSVELGVTEIDLLHTARVQPNRYKMSRLNSKAVAALKQSGRAYLPAIRELDFTSLLAKRGAGLSPKPADASLLRQPSPPQIFLIAHCEDSLHRSPLTKAIAQQRAASASAPDVGLHLLIGPEGDFTTFEVEEAEAAGFVPVSLGEARLRTETAAIAALAVWSLR